MSLLNVGGAREACLLWNVVQCGRCCCVHARGVLCVCVSFGDGLEGLCE